MRGSSLVESFFFPALGELSLEEDGGWTPLGRDPPFRRNAGSGAEFPFDRDADPEEGGSFLFMLLIRSRTVLFLLPEGVTVDPVEEELFSLIGDCESPKTDVISPDFLSTPTIDQGRGLGKGLGLRGPMVSAAVTEETFVAARALGSGDVPPVMLGKNFVARSPTMDPLGSSLETDVTDGLISAVGDVRFPTNPVDLFRNEI